MKTVSSLLTAHPFANAGSPACGASPLFRILWVSDNADADFGHLYLLSPGSHVHLPAGHQWAGYLLTFPEEMLLMTGCRHFHPFASFPAAPVVWHTAVNGSCNDTGRYVRRLIASLVRECQRPSHSADTLLPGLLKVLLVYISRFCQQPQPSEPRGADQHLFQRFMHLIGEKGSERKGIQDYARALAVRTDVLSETVRKVSGYPASHHIYEHMIRTAKQAAISSGASMKEVAYNLGFKDMAHFSKFFRNKAGMTYSDYKKAYQTI
ncbi:hypothetical protein GCM10010967_55200 [Dyadobacter beijingensis]|uniref:HTH araC/xylS-type domain-containing protein n=1 Tax=Dyadobacter beijingensis TaxID=365489 RepID=A0ABQ2IIZ2_9BACT|nr:helix-turn-helix domain-containing protein [Dyadobacter beijingensis]GGN12154.1 hypothetical protein GCM10010967_55200 [Dyadobacter beijingensis]